MWTELKNKLISAQFVEAIYFLKKLTNKYKGLPLQCSFMKQLWKPYVMFCFKKCFFVFFMKSVLLLPGTVYSSISIKKIFSTNVRKYKWSTLILVDLVWARIKNNNGKVSHWGLKPRNDIYIFIFDGLKIFIVIHSFAYINY